MRFGGGKMRFGGGKWGLVAENEVLCLSSAVVQTFQAEMDELEESLKGEFELQRELLRQRLEQVCCCGCHRARVPCIAIPHVARNEIVCSHFVCGCMVHAPGEKTISQKI